MNRSASRLLIGGFSLLASAACNEQPTDLGPAGLIIIQAPSTAGAPGWELIDTLVVRAVDPSGTPRGGVTVSWSVREGGGSIAPTAETADADGYAKAVWTLGSTSGVNKVWASTPEGGQAEFQSTGEAFRVDRLASTNSLGCGLVGGAVWCWGRGWWVPAAPPSFNPGFGARSSSPALVDDSHGFVDLAVGGDAVCALDRVETVWCATRSGPLMAQQGGLPAMRTLSTNQLGWGGPAERLCGLAASDSTVWCWVPGGTSTQLVNSPSFTSLRMSTFLACGLLSDSTAACWGTVPPGDGSTGPSDTAVAVSGGHRFVELAMGWDFACGRTSAGEVWCWGNVDYPPSEAGAVVPVVPAGGANRLGADWEFVAYYTAGNTLNLLRLRSTITPESYIATGLEGLPVTGFSNSNSFSCVHLADKQVYCYDDMWDYSSRIPIDSYSPVQPVRSIPLTAQTLK